MFKFILSFFSISFLFLPLVSQTIIFSEDFQNPNALANWKIVNEDGFTPAADVSEYTEAWILTLDPSDSSDTVVSATSYFTSPERANRWLISPAITLGDFGNFISWNAKSFDPSFPEDYKILYSTTGNNVEDFTDTLALFISENYVWNTYDFNLSEKNLDNQQIYIAFVLTTYDANRIFIDDISIRKEDPLALNENFLQKTLIFPNPSSNFITLKHDSNQKISFETLDGKKIINSNFDSDKINISFLNEGCYFVKYSNNGKEIIEKFYKN